MRLRRKVIVLQRETCVDLVESLIEPVSAFHVKVDRRVDRSHVMLVHSRTWTLTTLPNSMM